MATVHLRSSFGVVLAFALAATCGACAPSGGGSGGAATSAASTSPGTSAPGGPSATQTRQWQTALAALALPPQAPRLEPAAVAVWDDLIARHWPHARALVEPAIEAQLRAAAGTALAGVRILSIRAITLDLAAAPHLSAGGSAGATQGVALELPGAPGAWALHVDADIGGTIPIQIAGISTAIAISLAARISVTDIQVREAGTIDVSTPAHPRFAGHAVPQIGFRLAVTSPDPLVSTIASTLTQVLDPIVRLALVAGTIIADQQIGLALTNIPSSAAWGRGGPPLPAPTGGVDLQRLAESHADDIRAFMSPFGHVYPTEFDQPVSGGNPIGPKHFGDSALWTGGALAAEALRFDVTGDPRALAGVTHLLRGVELLSEVVPAPFEGLLARCAIPLSSPFAARINGPSSFQGRAGSVDYACYGDTSRDSYTGVTAGLGQTVARVPSLRADAGRVAGRLLDHLDRMGYAVYQAPGQGSVAAQGAQRMSVSGVQSPSLILSLTHVAAAGDPARWSALLARHGELASLLWLPGWLSAQEVHEGYFKFSLENFSLLTLSTFETDPARYRGYLQLLAVLRETVGHHQNPWFDALAGGLVPPTAAALAPDVRAALEAWSRRPRRGFDCKTSLDPTVPHTTYTTSVPNASGSPSSPVQMGPRTQLVAVYPVPIEKRPPTAFLWSSAPFELDGWEDPYVQNPGIDLLLPYWVGRAYGVLK